MSNHDLQTILSSPVPRSLKEALHNWPRRDSYTRSPGDWRDQVFYFLLPDRFSNGQEDSSRLLDCDLSSPEGRARIGCIRGTNWNWRQWQTSGAEYFQGGTLKGVQSKLGYLSDLGVTTLWVGPIFHQRVEENTYHGYGIQNFLDVDPRFGTRRDLVELVDAAHSLKMHVILDIIFNHSGCNWLYDPADGDIYKPPYRDRAAGPYRHIHPRNGYGFAMDRDQPFGDHDYVWPEELQSEECYLRAGCGSLGGGDLNDDHAEHKRTDFENLRKFNLFLPETLRNLVLSYHYWIALADIDGFRIDTFKHVTQNQARDFCNAVKEYAEVLGKNDFFMVAEVAGGNTSENRYLDVTGRNLNACLDIGEQREIICGISKGLESPYDFFAGFDYYDPGMGSHRNWGSLHMSISNDHDHVFGSKIRFAADASNDHQGAIVAAVQLFTLGLPCLYYGTEQGLASGAEQDARQWLTNWGGHDCLLRETMFGPEHPRAKGWEGAQGQIATEMPGYGPHGTAGYHVFNRKHPIYERIAQLCEIRKRFIPLRRGRQYRRETAVFDYWFSFQGAGELLAWSRIFDDQEVLVVINPHGVSSRGGRVVVDGYLSETGMTVVANTDLNAPPAMKVGATLSVQKQDRWNYLEIFQPNWTLGPSEVMVLANSAAIRSASQR